MSASEEGRTRSMATYDGTFHAPIFNLEKWVPPNSRSSHGEMKGAKPFLTAPPKKGQTASTLGPGPRDFKRLFEEEPYVEPSKLFVKDRKKSRQKFITSNGFRYSSPMKKSSSSGDYYATFSGPMDHLDDGTYDRKGRKEKVEVEIKRNICTRPMKNGTFGFPNILIGEDYNYIESPFELKMIKDKEERELKKKKCGERKPFSSMCRPREYFDVQDHVKASQIFSTDESCIPPPEDPDKDKLPRERVESKIKYKYGTFRPNSPTKKGPLGTFSKFPLHTSCPYDEKKLRRALLSVRRHPLKSAMAGCSDAIKERKAFLPSSGTKTMLTRSPAIMSLKHSIR